MNLTLITDEVLTIEKYINDQWPQFKTVKEQRLNKILPEPENKGLRHIWSHGSADLVVSKGGKILCVIEPGGAHHVQDEKQIKNDKRKWKLCEQNGISCLKIMNGVFDKLSKRQQRKLIGGYLWQ